MRPSVASLLFALACPAVAPCQHEDLAAVLGGEPLALLRAIGSASDQSARNELVDALREKASNAAITELIRFGLGHADERAVFGAVILCDSDRPMPPYPELRHAAPVAIRRFGDADCPLAIDRVIDLCGSVDVPSILARLPQLDEGVADHWLAQAHRILRAEHVPALCAFALERRDSSLGRTALGLAELVGRYADRHVELVVETGVKYAGREGRPSDSQMPPILCSALELHVEAAAERIAKGAGGSGTAASALRWLPNGSLCVRWLDQCRVGPVDVPLLERLLDAYVVCFAAMRALGRIADPRDEPLLRRHTEYVSARYALALRGDANELEALLAEPDAAPLSLGLSAASPERRRAFAAHLVSAPPEQALEILEELAQLAAGCVADIEALPYDVAWFADLEPIAAAAEHLDLAVLRALVAAVPSCATIRLADRLLAVPPEALFATRSPEELDEVFMGFEIEEHFRGELGFSGAWPFLEVTRPAAFRTRLHEGLTCVDEGARAVCADLLLRLGDRDAADSLLARALQLEAREIRVPWLRLATLETRAIRELLEQRLAAAGEDEDIEGLLCACAVARGMPRAVADAWSIESHAMERVRALLLSGSAGRAWLATQDEDDSFWPLELYAWLDPEIQLVAATQRGELEFEHQVALGALEGDPESRRILRDLTADGRYASHHVFQRGRTAGGDLSRLEFWIDETGTNCCRYIDSAVFALEELFGSEPEYAMSQFPEPLVARLRKHLLPLRDRFRWSVLANGYIVCGI